MRPTWRRARSERRSLSGDSGPAVPAVGTGEATGYDGEVGFDATAGVGTQRQRGTTTTVRFTLWVLILLAPTSVLADRLFPAAPTVVRASSADPASGGDPTAPAGCAALFVKTYLIAGRDDAATYRRYFPAARAPEIPTGARSATGLQAVAAHRLPDNTWSVIVAADVAIADKNTWRATGTRFFQLPIGTTGDDGAACAGFRPLALPAEVPAPAESSTKPQLAYSRVEPVTGTPLADAVAAFLTAYLAGGGDVERYTAPGAGIHAVTPAPYSRITVESLRYAADGTRSTERDTVPADGARRRLLVSVTAADQAKTPYALEYALTAATRGGRWEIVALDPAPVQQRPREAPASSSPTTDPRPTPTPSSTGPS